MPNFTSIIDDMIAKGVPVEDITSALSSTLNSVLESNKRKKEEEEKKEREALLSAATHNSQAVISRNIFSYKSATDVAMLAAAANHPDWSASELKCFSTSIADSISVGEKMIEGARQGNFEKVAFDLLADTLSTHPKSFFKDGNNNDEDTNKILDFLSNIID